jgi:hypothetical protein
MGEPRADLKALASAGLSQETGRMAGHGLADDLMVNLFIDNIPYLV